jgi:shikimate dehydrogenase
MQKFRVFGNPIAQSKSPFIHQQFAHQCHLEIEYKSQLVALDGFNESVNNFFKAAGKGINVTLPFKEQAFAMCDKLSDEAKAAGAVNTLTYFKGEIFGENSDGVGLINDLRNQHVELSNQRILLIGAGGAAKGVILPLLKQNPSSLTIANRTLSKAQALKECFAHANLHAASFNELVNAQFDVIINATSASLSGTVPNIPVSCVNSKTTCYDMVYADKPTSFMQWSMNNSCKLSLDGLGMLVEQAARSFEVWHNVKPETAPVLKLLREQLLKK